MGYMPLAAAPAPECGEKIQPSMLLGAREDSRDRWHGQAQSARSTGEPVAQHSQQSLASPTSSTAQHHHQNHSPTAPPPPPLFQSICSQPNTPAEILPSTTSYAAVAATSNSVPASRPLPVSQPLIGTPAITTSLTSAAPVAVPAPPPLLPPPMPQSVISQQPYSAFHSCISSHSTDQRWYGGQEHAEDLSISRPSKHYLDDDSDLGSSKRRSSDDDSDNCDNDDTVGRRVKERKRIKLDAF